MGDNQSTMELIHYMRFMKGRQLFSALLVLGIGSYLFLFMNHQLGEHHSSCERGSRLLEILGDITNYTRERAQLEDLWRPVSEKYKLYVYSAFYDYR